PVEVDHSKLDPLSETPYQPRRLNMRKRRVQLMIVLVISVTLANSFSLAFPVRARTNIKPAASLDAASEMPDRIESYNNDRGNLSRTNSDALSPARRARFKKFYEQWRDSLAKLNFEALSLDDRIDYLLFKNHLDHELRLL